MDFELASFLVMVEIFAQHCAPYACIGPNAEPVHEPESVVIERTTEDVLQATSDACMTWRKGIEMPCAQGAIWDQQRAGKTD